MRKILLILLTTVVFSYDWKINFSNFSDGTTYMKQSGIEYKNTLGYQNFIASYSDSIVGDYSKVDFLLNIDNDNQKLSNFMFLSYNNNTRTGIERYRAGIGIAYTPYEKVLVFPYMHKVSVALVQEDKTIVSWRYKLKGYYEKIGFESILFHLGYTWNMDSKITYNLSNNIAILYNDNREDGYITSSLGMEVKF